MEVHWYNPISWLFGTYPKGEEKKTETTSDMPSHSPTKPLKERITAWTAERVHGVKNFYWSDDKKPTWKKLAVCVSRVAATAFALYLLTLAVCGKKIRNKIMPNLPNFLSNISFRAHRHPEVK